MVWDGLVVWPAVLQLETTQVVCDTYNTGRKGTAICNYLSSKIDTIGQLFGNVFQNVNHK